MCALFYIHWGALTGTMSLREEGVRKAELAEEVVELGVMELQPRPPRHLRNKHGKVKKKYKKGQRRAREAEQENIL